VTDKQPRVNSKATNPKAPSDVARGRREISDPRAMRALAHPMRIALLEAIMREGSLTATRAAELLDDSPGNMSWHLQTLAKYGYIEEAGGGRGRSRPWRIVDVSYNFESATNDPEHAAAAEALEVTLHQNIDQNLRAWWSRRRGYSEEWRRAAFSIFDATYLTVEEMDQLSEDINELLKPFNGRSTDKAQRPEGAEPVQVMALGHPVPSMRSGT
jgi:DNA-binding transcriptional ArsR family regulator